MRINCIATGSSGNLYEILDSKGNSMLLEAGVPRDKFIKYRVGVTPPEMLMITHSHGDHSFYRAQYSSICNVIKYKDFAISSNFQVIGFPVKHGKVDNLAFIIKFKEDDDYLFFGTDMEYDDEFFEPIFQQLRLLKVDKFLIECNYNDYLYHLAEPIQKQGCDAHFSDNNLVKFMRQVEATDPKIITIHGSERLSADTYTRKLLKAKLPTATIAVAVGAKNGVKQLIKL